MRYTVGNVEIRSENAAKPMSDASAPLIQWIKNHKNVGSALDYGCGKLRYTKYLFHICKSLGIVDSKVQLTRQQIIDSRRTTVKQYVNKKWPSCSIYELEKFLNGKHKKYDLILCANVLSAIPSKFIRGKSLKAIYDSLAVNGEAIFINQHTNSYFNKIAKGNNSIEHLDGWVHTTQRGTFYYGILNKEKVKQIVARYGFKIIDDWIEGQSNYVVVSR